MQDIVNFRSCTRIVRGLTYLRQAHVVVYDRLIHPALLHEAQPNAECIDVGKAPGRHIYPQTTINALRLSETETARFHTRSGLLTTRMDADGWIEMDFPTRLATPAAPPEGLLASLNVSPLFVGRDVDDYLIEVDSPQVIDDLEPDFGQLAQIETRGVIVTSH